LGEERKPQFVAFEPAPPAWMRKAIWIVFTGIVVLCIGFAALSQTPLNPWQGLVSYVWENRLHLYAPAGDSFIFRAILTIAQISLMLGIYHVVMLRVRKNSEDTRERVRKLANAHAIALIALSLPPILAMIADFNVTASSKGEPPPYSYFSAWLVVSAGGLLILLATAAASGRYISAYVCFIHELQVALVVPIGSFVIIHTSLSFTSYGIDKFPPPTKVTGIPEIQSVSVGPFHVLALGSDGSVWMWGRTSEERGWVAENYGPAHQIALPGESKPVAVSAGRDFSLVLRRDGTVWAWGRNDDGQLGRKFSGTYPVPAHSTPMQVADLQQVTSIAAGENYSLALAEDGTVWLWGHDRDGMRDYVNYDADRVVNTVRCPLGSKLLAAGDTYMLFLYDDGKVWVQTRDFPKAHWLIGVRTVWEDGPQPPRVEAPSRPLSQQEPDKGDQGLSNIISVKASGTSAIALDEAGNVWTWQCGYLVNASGRPDYGFSGLVKEPNLTDVVDVAVGDSHFLALKNDGTVWTWGSNSFGQLGRAGHSRWDETKTPQQVPGLSKIRAISAGGDSSTALAADGSVWQWGMILEFLNNPRESDWQFHIPLSGTVAAGAGTCLILCLIGLLLGYPVWSRIRRSRIRKQRHTAPPKV
jgi:alpha-tubulin suppressor-like RCC1 family protein